MNNKNDNRQISQKEIHYFQTKLHKYLPKPPAELEDEKSIPQDIPSYFFANKNQIINTSIDVDEEDDFKRPGLQNSQMTSLRSGKISFAAELDLHGMTVKEAASSLTDFINNALYNRYQSIKIIYGKGYSINNTSYRIHKDGGEKEQQLLRGEIKRGKLKIYVLTWLRSSPMILGICRALPKDGGSGAAYVLLKKLTK